jgi:hypothetical protein
VPKYPAIKSTKMLTGIVNLESEGALKLVGELVAGDLLGGVVAVVVVLDGGGGAGVGGDGGSRGGVGSGGIEGELVGHEGVAGLGVDEMGELGVDAAGRGRSFAAGVEPSGALGVDGGRGLVLVGGVGRDGAGDGVVEDVEGKLAGGFDTGGSVGVVGLKVSIKDKVVPGATLGKGGAEVDGDGPEAGGGGFKSHGISLSVVVPRASDVARLDVGGSAEGEGDGGSGARHFVWYGGG